jgi:thiol-disulfide isomerase/thioredoxin
MKTFKTTLIFLGLCLFLFAAVDTENLGGPKPGEKAPLFAVKSIMYENFTLFSALQEAKENNELIILDFWATWCVPCKKEFPIFESIYKELEEKGAKFYAISIDSKRQDVWNYVKNESKVTFPVLFDQNAFNAGKKYGANELLPQLFIIDQEGIVRARHVGEIENLEAVLKHEIETLKPGSFPKHKDIEAKLGEIADKADQ